MQEEIFGFVLFVFIYLDIDEVIELLGVKEKLLVFYFFGCCKVVDWFFCFMFFGGVCINDILLYVVLYELFFGGVGNSGMGSYYGWKIFDIFIYVKLVVSMLIWMDLLVRYLLFCGFGFFKCFLQLELIVDWVILSSLVI